MTAQRESLGRSDLLQCDVPTLVNMANFRALLAFISIHHESSTGYPLETNVLDSYVTHQMMETSEKPQGACWKQTDQNVEKTSDHFSTAEHNLEST